MDVFAERRLVMATADGTLEVMVRLGKPVPDNDLDSWKCPYEVWFGGECNSFAMHGIDSLQALQLSISVLDAELERGAKRHGGNLQFLDEPFVSVLEHSGMPRPKT